MALRHRLTYSWTSRSSDFSSVIGFGTRLPAGEAAEAELARAQRPEVVAQRGGALEVEVGGRRLHFALELGDVGVELGLGAKRHALLARRRRRRVVALVNARQHLVDVAYDRLGRDAVLLVIGGLQRPP